MWLETGSGAGITRVITKNDEFVGSVGAIPKTNEKRYQTSIGYWLGEAFWDQGIAVEALVMLTDDIFSTTAIIKLFAGVYSPNKVSMRVLQKADYDQVIVLKKAILKTVSFMMRNCS